MIFVLLFQYGQEMMLTMIGQNQGNYRKIDDTIEKELINYSLERYMPMPEKNQ
jgi:hypothetical protein